MITENLNLSDAKNCECCKICPKHIELLEKNNSIDKITENNNFKSNDKIKNSYENDFYIDSSKSVKYDDNSIYDLYSEIIEGNFKCIYCERKYSILKSYEIHSKNCSKHPAKKQRKVFDSSKQRNVLNATKLFENEKLNKNEVVGKEKIRKCWQQKSSDLRKKVHINNKKISNDKITPNNININEIDIEINTTTSTNTTHRIDILNNKSNITCKKVKNEKSNEKKESKKNKVGISDNYYECKNCLKKFTSSKIHKKHKIICEEENFWRLKINKFNSLKQRMVSYNQFYLYKSNLDENNKYNNLIKNWKKKSSAFQEGIKSLKKLNKLGFIIKRDHFKLLNSEKKHSNTNLTTMKI